MTEAAEVDATVLVLRTIADQLAEVPPGATRCMPVKDAAYIAGISEAQMRRRCELSVFSVDRGGYGRKIGARWWVVIAPFILTLPVGALHRVNMLNRARMRD